MTKEEIRGMVKELPTSSIGIFSNQISTYIGQIRNLGSELNRMEEENRRRDIPRLFDFEKRGITLNLKMNEALTFHEVLIDELDLRIEKELGLKLDYEYIEGVMDEIVEIKRGS